MLTAVLAVSMPSLAPFFRGRTLDNEARRLLMLTRYGRSEAITRSIPMDLWIDTNKDEYGLMPKVGYDFEGSKPVQFQLAKDLHFDLRDTTYNTQEGILITFLPDGSVGENSVRLISVYNDEQEFITIEKLEFSFEYVIRDENNERDPETTR